jgi:capsular polysaccharide biosynthesis protein
MANTGILISPHGAALTNIIFMPRHAVVIEVVTAFISIDPVASHNNSKHV